MSLFGGEPIMEHRLWGVDCANHFWPIALHFQHYRVRSSGGSEKNYGGVT